MKSDGRIVDMKKNVKLDQDLLDGILTKGGQKLLTKSKDGEINENVLISNESEKNQKQNENEIYNRYRKVWK